jgi:hypothetical protein
MNVGTFIGNRFCTSYSYNILIAISLLGAATSSDYTRCQCKSRCQLNVLGTPLEIER